MEQYLRATRFLDITNPAVQTFAESSAAGATSDVNRAIKLYYAVRDGIRYNPYAFGTDADSFVASAVLKAGQAFCIPKAILLAAAARVVGIPSRLNFADVRNHLSSPRLIEVLGTHVFTFHGSTELYLNGRWIKVTPAFNKTLCEKLNVAPLEFDGVHEAIFQPYDAAGSQFMEYLADHGSFDDMPFDKMVAAFKHHYPHLFGATAPVVNGDMESEVESG